jgi:hypothetical protein
MTMADLTRAYAAHPFVAREPIVWPVLVRPLDAVDALVRWWTRSHGRAVRWYLRSETQPLTVG